MPVYEDLPKMIDALSLEVAAIKKKSRASRVHLRNGVRQESTSAGTIYAFPLTEDKRQFRDDSPVSIAIDGREIRGAIVSVTDGVILISLEEDQGPHIPSAVMTVDDSFLVERLRQKLTEIKDGQASFHHDSATRAVTGQHSRVSEIPVPAEILTSGDQPNAEQLEAVRKSGGSELLYVWGPPGTGKTSVLSAIVHLLYRLGKTVLLVSNTNIAVDTALEKIAERLKTDEGFQRGAVLRYGPITSTQLRERHEQYVNVDKIVERLSHSFHERKQALKRESGDVASEMSAIESALKEFDTLAALDRSVVDVKERLVAAHNTLQAHHNALATAKQEIAKYTAELARAKSMWSITKRFLGINEEHIRQLLREAVRIADAEANTIQQLSKYIGALIEKRASLLEQVRQQKERMRSYSPEVSCRRKLAGLTARLDKIAAEIKRLDSQIDSLRAEVVKNCRVLGTTVYQSYLKADVAKEYDVVIVDEASMLALPLVFYASGLAKEKVIIAGDFRQLPPIVMSDDPLAAAYLKRDVFHAAGISDAVKTGRKCDALTVLREQYRMQEPICTFINDFFYDNRLRTASLIRNRRTPALPGVESHKHFLYVDTSRMNPWAAYRLGSFSRYNIVHGLLVRNLVRFLGENGFVDVQAEHTDRIGIMSPYSAQTQLIIQLIGESLRTNGAKYAATVHRFQGSEKDLVVFDLTDSTGVMLGKPLQAHSLEDDATRLINVALSRSRFYTVLVGNFEYLRSKASVGGFIPRILDFFRKYGQCIDPCVILPIRPSEVLKAHRTAFGFSSAFEKQDVEACDANTFYPSFANDCREASRSIVIFSPYATEPGTARWVELWRAKMAEGVKVRIVTRPPGIGNGPWGDPLRVVIEKLRSLGFAIDFRGDMHEKIAFIDGRILWHGSLNILSHSDTSESMLRIKSRIACEQLAKFVGCRPESRDDPSMKENPDCPICNSVLIWINGKYGEFFRCSNPNCRRKFDGRWAREQARRSKASESETGGKRQGKENSSGDYNRAQRDRSADRKPERSGAANDSDKQKNLFDRDDVEDKHTARSESSSVSQRPMTEDEIFRAVTTGRISCEEAERLLSGLKPRRGGGMYCKVSEKGAISVYGLQRMPVTLYVEQWRRLLEYAEEMRRFIENHRNELNRRQ